MLNTLNKVCMEAITRVSALQQRATACTTTGFHIFWVCLPQLCKAQIMMHSVCADCTSHNVQPLLCSVLDENFAFAVQRCTPCMSVLRGYTEHDLCDVAFARDANPYFAVKPCLCNSTRQEPKEEFEKGAKICVEYSDFQFSVHCKWLFSVVLANFGNYFGRIIMLLLMDELRKPQTYQNEYPFSHEHLYVFFHFRWIISHDSFQDNS